MAPPLITSRASTRLKLTASCLNDPVMPCDQCGEVREPGGCEQTCAWSSRDIYRDWFKDGPIRKGRIRRFEACREVMVFIGPAFNGSRGHSM